MNQDRAAMRNELRQQLRSRRRALPPSDRIQRAERLARQLLALPFAPRSGYVAGYWAMDGEIALHAWQLQLPPECVYCLPVLHHEERLCFAPWRPGDDLISNKFGIPEPDVAPGSLLDAEQIAFAVLPLVGFDVHGQRLGMGGGWYDRSFAFRRNRSAPPWLVGAGFACQQIEPLDVAEWDVAIDAVCTDAGTLDFRALTL